MKAQDHRILRAFERYGLTLTREDIAQLERQVSPANRMRKEAMGGVHVLDWHGLKLIAAVIERPQVVIATFLPPDYFVAGRRGGRSWARLSRAEQKRRAKHSRRLA